MKRGLFFLPLVAGCFSFDALHTDGAIDSAADVSDAAAGAIDGAVLVDASAAPDASAPPPDLAAALDASAVVDAAAPVEDLAQPVDLALGPDLIWSWPVTLNGRMLEPRLGSGAHACGNLQPACEAGPGCMTKAEPGHNGFLVPADPQCVVVTLGCDDLLDEIAVPFGCRDANHCPPLAETGGAWGCPLDLYNGPDCNGGGDSGIPTRTICVDP